MYLTVKQVLKHLTKEEYLSLKELSHIAKNLSNEAIYNVRQYYFNEGEYLNYEKNYTLLKDSVNYKMLNSNMAQQILKEVDGCRESGYLIQNLLKIIKLFKPSGLYNMTMRVKLYGPFLYKKKGRTQHLTSVSSFTEQCFR